MYMKATGIVRRIDDLGRVVIPKEIRRTMRIREGDPLEIYTEKDGEVIFKKYSPIGELSNFVGAYTETVNKATGLTAIITDKDSVIAASGLHKKELFDRRLTAECEKLLEDRKPYIYKVGERRIQIAENQEKLHAGICAPINVDGDIIGSIILLIDDMGAQPSESDIKLVSTSSQLLAKQLEA
ncbi:MAG: AbrB/MazE/SpoVT family DNA-binding domain-containing protein [Clostridia bacterium]|nr:AbrB/MazE/SpoVT family DNA-binding domain-containing protein [Clostridia bacterium]